MIALALLILASGEPAECRVARLTLTLDAPVYDGWDETCAQLVAIVSPPVHTLTSSDARDAERVLAETTLFQTTTCTIAAGDTLSCAMEPGILVSDGEVTGSLPFVLLRSDVDRRLSLRSGVPVDDLGAAGLRQAERVATFLEREGYFGTTATASWTPTEGSEPMRTAAIDVHVESGDSALLRDIKIEGGVLEEDVARGILERYWILSFIQRRFRPFDFDDDVEAITETLRGRYPEAVVRGSFTVDRAANAVDVTLVVDPGPRLDLAFEGNLAIDTEDLTDLSTFAKAHSLDAEEIDSTAAAIIDAYQKKGFFEVAVSGAPKTTANGATLVTYTIVEGRQGHLTKVTVSGTIAMGGDLLGERTQLWTQTRSWPLRSGSYVDAWVERDRRVMTEVLKSEGHGAPKIEINLYAGSAGELTAHFDVDAGPQRTIGKLDINGLPEQVDREALLALVSLKPGTPYVAASQTPDRRAILDALAGAAYPRAEIARKMKMPLANESGEVSVTYNIEAGPRAMFGGLLVRGLMTTSPSVIDENVLVQPGEPLGAKALSDLKRRLSVLGVFGTVEVAPIGLWRDDRPTYVLLGLEERARVNLFAVLSFSTEDFFSAGIDFGDRNLFGRALSLDLVLRFANASELGTTVKIGYRDYTKLRLGAPRPFGAPFDIEASAFYDLILRDVFIERRVGGSLAMVRELVERTDCSICPSLIASLGYELQATRLDLSTTNEPQVTFGRVFLRLLADRRDSVIDPRAGWQAELRLELANRVFAGPLFSDAKSFWRVLPSMRGYLPLGAPLELRLDEDQTIGGPFVLAASASYGVAHPYGSRDVGAEALPGTETFAFGGDQSVRGMSDGASRAGYPVPTYLLVVSGEVRYYALQNFGFGTVELAGFIDLGAVSYHLGDLFDSPTVSAGPAIRYVTPIGPLSMAYGWPLLRSAPIVAARPDLITTTGRFHLSFGTAF